VQWRGWLVFGTGNGLYVSKPGTNRVSCVLNTLDLELYSLCPVGDRLFVGTNTGIYRIDAPVFDATMAAIDGEAAARHN
jgi:ligand-binding sensor domain-containing protein